MNTKIRQWPHEGINLRKDKIPFSAIFPFLIISFGLAWSILGLFIFMPEQMTYYFGMLNGQHPLFYLAVYAPAIAAFTIVIFAGGIKGLQEFLSRFLLWRCSFSWYVFLLVGIPLVFLGGSYLRGNLFTDPFLFTTTASLIMALLLAFIKGPVEEFGWRGIALPLLQRKLAPFWAAIILGVIWGIWHLPAFLLSGTQQSNWAFAPFLLGCIALSVIVTPLFNASGGSILLTAFFHFMVMNPIFPDAEPYDTYILLFVAALIVWNNRKTMFTKEGTISHVIPLANW